MSASKHREFVSKLRRPMENYYKAQTKKKVACQYGPETDLQRELEVKFIELFGENTKNNEEAS